MCPRCKYSTPHKWLMRQHLQRKKKCKPVYSTLDTDIILNDMQLTLAKNNDFKIIDKKDAKKFQCKFCNKCYTTKGNLKRHQTKCKLKNMTIVIKEKDIEGSMKEVPDKETALFSENSSQLKELHNEITGLKKQLDKIKCEHTTYNIQNNTVNNNSINININSFGN